MYASPGEDNILTLANGEKTSLDFEAFWVQKAVEIIVSVIKMMLHWPSPLP